MTPARALPFVVLVVVVGAAWWWSDGDAPSTAPSPVDAPVEPSVPVRPATPAPAPAPTQPPTPAADRPETVVDHLGTRDRLLGRHPLSLQWISWGAYGEATVTDDNGLLRIAGRQDARRGADFLAIDGVITHVEEKRFTFKGAIETRVSHIHGGKTCRREGTFHFRATGKRRYFRLKEMTNPCEGGRLVDYIDLFWTHSLEDARSSPAGE